MNKAGLEEGHAQVRKIWMRMVHNRDCMDKGEDGEDYVEYMLKTFPLTPKHAEL